ncbi:hypothetical protein [Actinopolymorpha pittospori]
MKLYADAPGRRNAQVLMDLLTVVWIWVSIRIAVSVHSWLNGFATAGQELEDAGSGIEQKVSQASGQISGLPAVGDALRAPLDAIAGTGRSIATAGQTQQDVVHNAALIAALVCAGLLLLVAAIRLVFRIRWIIRASHAARMTTTEAGYTMLALRALVNQSWSALTSEVPDPAGSWRRGDPDDMRRLAGVELRSLGLRAAAAPSAPLERWS